MTTLDNGPKPQQQPRKKCPKGMKLHAQYKGIAAMMICNGATKAEARYYMRSMGMAIHEANNRSRITPRDASPRGITKTDAPDSAE